MKKLFLILFAGIILTLGAYKLTKSESIPPTIIYGKQFVAKKVGQYVYFGLAPCDQTDSDNVWRIQRIDTTKPNETRGKLAQGRDEYVFKFSEAETYTYK